MTIQPLHTREYQWDQSIDQPDHFTPAINGVAKLPQTSTPRTRGSLLSRGTHDEKYRCFRFPRDPSKHKVFNYSPDDRPNNNNYQTFYYMPEEKENHVELHKNESTSNRAKTFHREQSVHHIIIQNHRTIIDT